MLQSERGSSSFRLPEDVRIFLGSGGREAGASLVRIQLVVTCNPRLGIDLVEDTQHFVECLHLLGGAVVLVPNVCRKTSAAFIADSDAVRIVL